MKNVVSTCLLKILNRACCGVISNEKIDKTKVDIASKIIIELQNDMKEYTSNGSGPFVAAIYDKEGNLIVKTPNSVTKDGLSSNHAEMNAIRKAQEKLKTYDLSAYNLKLYVTSEPCIMCLGGIMWSGIKEVYFGVPSKTVEKITGFDEGFKPNWLWEFKKRGITVYGNIEPQRGEEELRNYMKNQGTIYSPKR